MTKITRSLVCLVLLLGLTCVHSRVSTYWPLPRTITGQGNQTWIIDGPDQIDFKVAKNSSGQIIPPYITELINFYKQKIFNTPQPIPELSPSTQTIELLSEEVERIPKRRVTQIKNTLNIFIENWALQFSYNDSYTLELLSYNTWNIYCQTYTGFVRAIETFSQTISHENGTFKMVNMPVQISDSAEFAYRGVMIDTSRHFIPVEILLQNLDAMMYNKMNSFHWHITDDDSFPLQVDSYPDLANNTAFGAGMTYSSSDVVEVINYGIKRGV